MHFILGLILVVLLIKVVIFLAKKTTGIVKVFFSFLFRFIYFIVIGFIDFVVKIINKILSFIRANYVISLIILFVLISSIDDINTYFINNFFVSLISFDFISNNYIITYGIISSFLGLYFISMIFLSINIIKELMNKCTNNYKDENNKIYQLLFNSIVFIIWGYLISYILNQQNFIKIPKKFNTSYVVLFYTLVSFMYLLKSIISNHELLKRLNLKSQCRKWRKQKIEPLKESVVENMIINKIGELSLSEKFVNYFDYKNIPYGRSLGFLSYFNKNLDNNQPLFFMWKIASKKKNYVNMEC